MKLSGKSWVLLLLLAIVVAGAGACLWLVVDARRARPSPAATSVVPARSKVKPIRAPNDPERFKEEAIFDEFNLSAEAVARQKEVIKARVRHDRGALIALLKERDSFYMAAGALMQLGDIDAETLHAFTDALRQGNLAGESRALLLQSLIDQRLVDAEEWIPWALQSSEWTIRRVGIGQSFNTRLGIPISRAIILAIPMLGDPIDANREAAWSLLKDTTGVQELGPDPELWETWWRTEGEEWSRSRNR